MKKHKQLQKLALRGIGYHHASLNVKGRQMVEMLFRMGFMQVCQFLPISSLNITSLYVSYLCYELFQ